MGEYSINSIILDIWLKAVDGEGQGKGKKEWKGREMEVRTLLRISLEALHVFLQKINEDNNFMLAKH